MRDDNYFQVGDKVVRVGYNTSRKLTPHPSGFRIQFGTVYCVSGFWEGPQHNVINVVGAGDWVCENGMPVGWPASAFRKVDDIKESKKEHEMESLGHEL